MSERLTRLTANSQQPTKPGRGPLSTVQLTERVMRERRLDLNGARLWQTMGRRVGACLNHWKRVRKIVRSLPGPGQVLLWEVVR